MAARCAVSDRAYRRAQKPFDPAEPGEAPLEGEAEPARGRLRSFRDGGVVGLSQIDQATIIAEIIVAQLRKAIEAQTFDDQPVEMPREEIGEEERAGLGLHHGVEFRLAGIEGIAMRTLDARHALLGEDAVERSAGAAIAIEAENLVIALAICANLAPHRLRDALRPIVQRGGQAGDVESAERAFAKDKDFPRQRATGQDQHAQGRLDAPRPVGLGLGFVRSALGVHASRLG